MKTTVLTLILLCTLFASPVEAVKNSRFKLPEPILAKIIDQAEGSAWGCSEEAKITLYDIYRIGNDKILLLLGIPDYLCDSNSFLPVTLDTEGTWRSGMVMEGRPEVLYQESETSLFMVTQWTIEGTYPTLFHSSDGIGWQQIALPRHRNVDCCFEWLTHICLYDERIGLTFEGDDPDKRAYYSAPRHNVTGTAPLWRRDAPHPKEACSVSSPGRLDVTKRPHGTPSQTLYETTLGGHTLSFILPQRIPSER